MPQRIGQPTFVAARRVTAKSVPLEMRGGVIALPSGDGQDSDATRLERARVLLGAVRYGQSVNPVSGLVEPAGPVGTAVFSNNNDMAPAYQAGQNGQAPPDPDKVTFNDETVQQCVRSYFSDSLQAEYICRRRQFPPHYAGLFRNFIRAAELGSAITVDHTLWHKPWPVDDATAALLRRAAKAFYVPEENISYNGKTLKDYVPTVRPVRHSGLDLEQSLLGIYSSLSVAQKLATIDGLGPAVHAFVERLALPDDIREMVEHVLQLPPLVQADERTPRQQSYHRELARKLPTKTTTDEGSYEGYVVAHGPLSEQGQMHTYGNLYSSDTLAFFRTGASDVNLIAVSGYGGWDLTGWDSYIRQHAARGGKSATGADMLSFTARRLETCDSSQASQTTGVLRSSNVPRMDDDACIGPLVRLAKVCQVPLAEVGQGKLLQRMQQIHYPKAKPPFSSQDLRDLRSVLSNSSNLTAEQRLAKLRDLVGPVWAEGHFTTLVKEARALLAQGDLASFQWSSLRKQQREDLLHALGPDVHIGASIALAGLLTRGSAKALSDAYEAQGYSVQDVALWTTAVRNLSSLPPEGKLWATEALEDDEPDFLFIPLRADLAVTKKLTSPALAKLEETFGPSDISGTLRAIIDRAGQLGAPSVAAVRAHLASGKQSPADLAYALSGEGGDALLAPLTNDLLPALEELRDADVVTREAALANVRAKVGQMPPESFTSALHELYRRDVTRIAPLEEAESAFGPVPAEEFIDPRPLSERIEQRSSPKEDLAQRVLSTFPDIAHRIEMVKNRAALQVVSGMAEDQVVAGALRGTEHAIAACSAKLSPAEVSSLRDHVEQLVQDRAMDFAR